MSNQMRIGKLKLKDTGKVFKPSFIPKKIKKQEQDEEDRSEDIKIKDEVINYEPVAATGQITVSGRTLHGIDTLFRSQVEKGDSILIQHPIFKTIEERAVTLVLSQKSLLLEEPFIEEYSTFTAFFIRKKSKVIVGENLTETYKQKLEEISKTKGIKKAEMDVRVKKGMWSYEKKKVQIEENLSREELLNKREKLIKDKFCW